MTNRSILISIALFGVLVSCSQPGLEGKKTELYGLRDERKSMNDKIKELEEEIKKEDPTFEAISVNSTLVSILTVEKRAFEHQFEVRGAVASRKNILVSAEVSGVVNSIKIREGQSVKKGQTMMVLDSESIRRNIDELNTQLEIAQIMFDRQSRLWEQSVGSEIQYLEAKNRKESVERRLASVRTELAKSNVRAPFSGTIDKVSIKEGEFVMTGVPLIRVVSLASLYIHADVSERFIGKLKKGDKVNVFFPTSEKRIESKIVAVSDVIDVDNRTFKVEVYLSKTDFPTKPNMVVILKMTDYKNSKAMVLPTKIIQRDDVGTFIYVVKDSNGKKVAEKLHVKTGVSFNSETEIHEGIDEGIVIVNDGFRDLTNGTVIEIADIDS